MRRLVIFTAVAVLMSACGARLDDDQRAAAIAATAGGTGTAEATDTGGGGDSFVADPGTVDPSAPTDSGPTGGSSGPARTNTGASSASPSGGSSPGASGGAACKPGSNTSDPGIDAKSVTIAVASDITGPSPGLFKASHDAVQAYANFINSQGGVCGRQLKVLKLDTKTESGGNRAAVLDACNKAFAMVGSMSAFDDGGAAAVDDCKIPDLTAIPTSPERVNAQWGFPVFPNRQDLLAVGNATRIKNSFGDAVIKKAGILWLNATVTRGNAAARRKAWESVGFQFVYQQEVQVLEANYTPFVQDMKDKGVQYVTMVADNNSISRLLKAAKQQGWAPTVWDWDSVAYDPGFIELAGDASEGSFVFVNTQMLEEANAVPEMARYAEWVSKSVAGAEPDYFGVYAWSAAALFVDTMVALGPDPTRQALFDKLKATATWDGHGIHGPHQLAKKIPTTCFLHMQIKGGKFTRVHPSGAGNLDCNLAGHASV